MHTVHEHYPAAVDGILNESARAGEVNEEVGVVDVLYTDAEVADTRGGVVGRNRLRTDGDNVSYTAVCQRPR